MNTIKAFASNTLVGVIGGTYFDSKYGLDFLRKKNIKAIASNISENPFEQTVLQLDSSSLTTKVKQIIIDLVNQKCTSIFIYCNSLSGAINLDYLRSYFNIPILTPIETYSIISKKHESMGLIAANCQSLGNIEKIILQTNPKAIVTGFASLLIVDSIEKGLSPNKIITKHDLLKICIILKNNNIDLLLLGCTHFSYFYDELINVLSHEKIHINLFDPSEYMLNNLLTHNQ